ncbi:hypothetical protein J4233_06415 [Candidatus Pacearchaeota archaeon]|nr:hypothetical protein [Candidatus Pacearchaeota archaeon]
MFRKAKERVNNYYLRGERFRKEVKREIKLLIAVTLGFTIAFTWRQTIFDLFEAVIIKFFSSTSQSTLSVLTSLAITLVSVLLIFLASYFLQEKDNGY